MKNKENFDIVSAILAARNPYPYKKQKCCVCGKTFVGFGNNPAPIAHEGRCCDKCNEQRVIPARYVRMALGMNPRA